MKAYLRLAYILCIMISCNSGQELRKIPTVHETEVIRHYFPNYESKAHLIDYHVTKNNQPIILFGLDTLTVWYYQYNLPKDFNRNDIIHYDPNNVNLKFASLYSGKDLGYISHKYISNHDMPQGKPIILHNGTVTSTQNIDSSAVLSEIECSQLTISFGQPTRQLANISINLDRKSFKKLPPHHNLYCINVIKKDYLCIFIISSVKRKLTSEIVSKYFK